MAKRYDGWTLAELRQAARERGFEQEVLYGNVTQEELTRMLEEADDEQQRTL